MLKSKRDSTVDQYTRGMASLNLFVFALWGQVWHQACVHALYVKVRNRAKLTAALLIYGSPVVLKCVLWSGLTRSAEMKWWDAPGGQKAALIFTTEKQKDGRRDVSWSVCVAFVRWQITLSSHRFFCTFFGFTKRARTRASLVAIFNWYSVGMDIHKSNMWSPWSCGE